MAQAGVETIGEGGLLLRVVRTITEMDQIRDDWVALEQNLGSGTNVFQTFSWCRIWADRFASSGNEKWSLCIFTQWKGNELVLVCPLAVSRHGPFKIARWLGDPLTQYGDVLASHEPENAPMIDGFWNELQSTQHFDLALFRFVRQDSAIARKLAGQTIEMSNNQAASVDLTQFENWSGFEDWFKGRHKKNSIRNWKRKRRRLEELGKLELMRINPGEEARRAVAHALELKAQWVSKSGLVDSTFSRSDNAELLGELAKSAKPNSECFLFTLALGDKPIAYDVGFASFGRLVSHVGAFDPDYAQFNPGHILTLEILARLIELGFNSYDMMTPASKYKLEWSNTLVGVRDYALPISRSAPLYINAYLKTIRPGIKSSLEAMPLGVRNVVQSLRGLRS